MCGEGLKLKQKHHWLAPEDGLWSQKGYYPAMNL